MNGHVGNSRQVISIDGVKGRRVPFVRPPGPIDPSMIRYLMYFFSGFEVLLHPFPKVGTQGFT